MPLTHQQTDLNQSAEAEKIDTQIETTSQVAKKNNTPLIIGGVVGALVLTALVAGVAMNGNKSANSGTLARNDNKSVASNQNAANTSKPTSMTQTITSQGWMSSENTSTNVNASTGVNPNGAVASQATDATGGQTTPTSQAPQSTQAMPEGTDTPRPLTQAETKIVEERKAVDKFLEVKAQENINLNPLTMTKEEAKIVKGSDNVSLEVQPSPEKKSQKFRVSLDYSNAGDMDFEKATLSINVDKALKIIPGTVKDTFGGQTIEVKNEIFVDNQAKYGPGSKDQASSPVKVGEKGLMTIDVEVPAGTAPGDYRISTVLEDANTGKAGVPGVFFLEVK